MNIPLMDKSKCFFMRLISGQSQQKVQAQLLIFQKDQEIILGEFKQKSSTQKKEILIEIEKIIPRLEKQSNQKDISKLVKILSKLIDDQQNPQKQASKFEDYYQKFTRKYQEFSNKELGWKFNPVSTALTLGLPYLASLGDTAQYIINVGGFIVACIILLLCVIQSCKRRKQNNGNGNNFRPQEEQKGEDI